MTGLLGNISLHRDNILQSLDCSVTCPRSKNVTVWSQVTFSVTVLVASLILVVTYEGDVPLVP